MILTGASQDGAAGLAAVQRRGGITCVQDPATAQAPLMIEAALHRTSVDYVRDLSGLGELLRGLTSSGNQSGPRRTA